MKKGFSDLPENPVRGAEEIRTLDPLHAMEMRYQLRHSPKQRIKYNTIRTTLEVLIGNVY